MADYATLAEVKERIDKTNADADAYLPAIITGASRAIDNFCNHPDGFVALTAATARYYAGTGTALQRIDECVEVTMVSVKDSVTDTTYTDWSPADWVAFSGDPRAPEFNRLPYDHLMTDIGGSYGVFTGGVIGGLSYFDALFMRMGRYNYNPRTARSQPTVKVTAKWGYAVTVPAPIKEACCMQAARWYKSYESAFSDVLASGEMGNLYYRKELHPDVKMILVAGRYVRPAIGRR
jgi:hypothetical protein